MEISFTLADLNETATLLWKQFSDRKVFAFHGEMGAGKTTFIHALCTVLNVRDIVSSPTFSIINEYTYPRRDQSGTLFHIDLYRLQNEDEAIRAGVEDCLNSGQICFVEWPERASGLLPPDTIHLTFEVVDQARRTLKINGN